MGFLFLINRDSQFCQGGPPDGRYQLLSYISISFFTDVCRGDHRVKSNMVSTSARTWYTTYVVDYYWGVKKEKHISFSDITSAEICIGYSHTVKGYRLNFAGMRYVVFKKGNRYLFKIIYLPETEEIFKQYLQ